MTSSEPLDIGTEIAGDVRIASVVETDALGYRYLVTVGPDNHPGELFEFMPRALAGRDGRGRLAPLRAEDAESLRLGLARFRAEAEALRATRHPNVAAVDRVIETRGTTCILLPCDEGCTLAAMAENLRRLPTQDELDRLVAPLIAALSSLHKRGVIHCSIGPETIRLGPDQTPMLVRFGATRAFLASRTRTVGDCVTPGYSAPELYLSDASAQGAACDVFSLAATLYRLVMGRAPVDVFQRNIGEAMSPAISSRGSYRPSFLAAIDAGIALDPSGRPASIEALGQRLLGYHASAPTTSTGPLVTEPAQAASRAPGASTAVPAATVAPSEAAAAQHPPASGEQPDDTADTTAGSDDASGQEAAAPGRAGRLSSSPARLAMLAAGLALLVGAGVGMLDLGRQSTKPADPAKPSGPIATAPPVKPASEEEARRQREELTRRQQKEQLDTETIATTRARERNARLAAIAETTDRDALFSIAGTDTTLLPQVEARLTALGFVRGLVEQRVVWVRPGEPFRDCATCPELVAVPPPVRSAAQTPKATPAAAAPASQPAAGDAPLAIGRFEVTRDEFAAFVTDTGYEPGAGCHARRPVWQLDPELSWKDPGYAQNGRHPVVCVSFDDAKAYVAWLNLRTKADYRLLTEDEWDHAARSGTATALRFPFGKDDRDICGYANGADQNAKETNPGWQVADCTDGFAATAPVGSFKPNHFGLYDTLGNVWEWVDSCGAAPGEDKARTPAVCTPRHPHILKGGSFSDRSDLLETSARGGAEPGVRDEIVGFRVARSLQPRASAGTTP